ncbi:AIPR family protein [Larsenimonas salina]|uniref:AIPR family protein n=1 Tax=Larsenimonas salina TaxID=1295565 RepID=UPI002073306A|nr:AIPR family protein [Larsenimonas salina]MCM5705633.1 AIPR family protein [Larsenimonas salina]
MKLPNRNDFVILNKKLEKYASILEKNLAISLNLNNEGRCRIGFYPYILENVCGETDISVLTDYIVDAEFNKIVYGQAINDHGIDAIFIDEDALVLRLFNFKYRKSFNPNQTQSLNDNYTSTKFLNFVINGKEQDYKVLPEKMKEKVLKANEIFNNPKGEWQVELYQVSNEAQEVKEAGNELALLAEQYAIQIIPLALPTILEYMSIRPEPIDATIILDSQAVMSYSESEKASAKSFIVRMKCSDLLRITCDSHDLREQVDLEDNENLKSSNLDFSVLFDNVRGFVRKSKYNENIAKTLKQNPKKFFMYNNGVTLVANSIDSRELPGKKKLKLNIKGFQVVNGGQTLRTIHEFNKKDADNLDSYLYDAEVLVRIFMPDSESDERHKIAEYTNSQNAIKSVDLKSLASEQIEIERFLNENNIAYARKSGDTGPDENKSYDYTIHMETFGKILKAMSGQPEKATNGLKEIFEGKYDDLFIEGFDMNAAPDMIKKYYSIIQKYKDKKINGNQLKFLYVLYFSSLFANFSEDKVIELLEENVKTYSNKYETTVVKALGSTNFRRGFESNLGALTA